MDMESLYELEELMTKLAKRYMYLREIGDEVKMVRYGKVIEVVSWKYKYYKALYQLEYVKVSKYNNYERWARRVAMLERVIDEWKGVFENK